MASTLIVTPFCTLKVQVLTESITLLYNQIEVYKKGMMKWTRKQNSKK